MKKILVVTGSARKQRATDGILNAVTTELAKRNGAEVTIGDIRDMDLPMMDSPVTPKSEDYTITHESVKKWRDMVAEADGVIMLTPEYNAGLSAAQKNAIDWLSAEWKDKPVAAISYGWGGADSARRHLSDVLERLEAKEVKNKADFAFMQVVNLDGTPIDESAVSTSISETIDALEKAI
jgi:NAD(P)H-dependent FMN reductase